jgi:hypothetical protein
LETTGAIEWSFNMKSFGNGSSVVAPRLDLNPLPPEDLDEVETGVKDLKKSKSKKKKSISYQQLYPGRYPTLRN